MKFSDKPEQFTPRERQVLVLLARGLNNKQIAAILRIEVVSVEQYLERIYGKLGFSRKDGSPRTAAALFALESGITNSEIAQFSE